MPTPNIPAIGTISDPTKVRVALMQGNQAVNGPPLSVVAAAVGVPSGGTTGQVLTKSTDADYDSGWADIPTQGDLSGPASAVDGNFVAFDGTTGKLVKDSGKKASDFATSAQGTKADNAAAGAASSTDNAVARFDGTGGKTLQDSSFIVDDSGNVTSFGGQIAFPSAANLSTNANTLDDYEEGTWTPTLTFATPGDLAITYNGRTGRYVKIGSLVFFNCLITTSAFTYSTAASFLEVTGFPFTMNAGFVGAGAVLMNGWSKAGFAQLNFETNNSASTFMFILAAGSGVSAIELKTTDVPSGGSIKVFASGAYTTSQ